MFGSSTDVTGLVGTDVKFRSDRSGMPRGRGSGDRGLSSDGREGAGGQPRGRSVTGESRVTMADGRPLAGGGGGHGRLTR